MAVEPLDDRSFAGYRRRLLEEIRERGIDDLAILQLFDRVPRHLFVPQGVWPRAYEDGPIPIGYGQTASQPSLQALYLSILDVGPDDTVMEIGTGSGFLTALLSFTADRVFSIERVRELSVRARAALDQLRIKNVALMVGDGTIGWRKYAPFDVIVVSAAAPSIPPAFIDQLGEGGRLLIPVGTRERQQLVLVRRADGEVHEEIVHGECTFVPLLGRFAWASELNEEAT
jgi:protein-L-isoaspartate(D-aspartate) O-methyltransferase